MLDNITAANRRMGSILATFGIQPGEGIAVGLLFSQSFLLGLAFFALYTAGTAIFLAHFEASAIAYVYVISACLLILVGIFFNRLERQIPFARLLLGSMGGLLLTLLLLRIGLWATTSSSWSSWVAFLLIVALRVCWTLMNLVIWTLAGRLFNVRQSKRLFPLIVLGTVLAIIISGLINRQLVDLLGVPNLLWISVGALVGAIGLLFITLRNFHESIASSQAISQPSSPTPRLATRKSRSAQSWQAFFAPYRDHYILWMITFSLLSTIANYVLEFIFIREANTYYQDAAAYAGFFGTYLGVTTLILLVVSLVSGFVFERLGLKFGLQSNSAAVTLFAIIFLIGSLLLGSWRPLFWLVVLTKLSDDVLVVAMTNTAQRILYQPIPVARRVSIQTVIESIVTPIAIGIVGLFLIALQFVGEASTRQLFLILIVPCLGWTFASVKIYGAYQDALRKALFKRRFAELELEEQKSAEIKQVLREGLRSQHPGVVLFSLNTLVKEGLLVADTAHEHAAGNTAQEILAELLCHDALEVRLDVAQRLERPEWVEQIGRSTASEFWLTLLQARLASDPSNQVRAALCRAQIALAEASGDQRALAAASASLFDPASDLRNATLVGLLRHGGIQSVLMAGPKLLDLVHSATTAERVLAAQLVGQVGESKFYQPLLQLLTDHEGIVRKAAIQASGEVKNAALWPLVAQGLAAAPTRKNATLILAKGGEAVLPTLFELFAVPGQSSAVQTALARVAGHIGGAKAAALLWTWLDSENNADQSEAGQDRAVRGEIWRALRCSGYKATADKQGQIVAQMEHELAQVSWLGTAWEVVHEAITTSANATQSKLLLADALLNEVRQSQVNLFELLTLICDKPLIMQVRRILVRRQYHGQYQNESQNPHDDNEQHAYAQEILDDLLPSTLKQHLLPFLAENLSSRSLAAIRERYPIPALDCAHWLLALINASASQSTPWTRVCALYAAGKLSEPEQAAIGLRVLLEKQQLSQEPLIQETARWYLLNIEGGAKESKFLDHA